MQKINLNFNLRSILTHFGEEKLSTTSLLRRQKFVVHENGTEKIYGIPIYSGNALRGQCRRLIVKDFIEKLAIDSLNLKVYHTFFTGGALVSGISLTMSEKKKLCSMLPFLSVLGAAVGDTILQGKISFSPAYLVCKELNEFNKTKSNISYKELIDEIFYIRKDDKKSSVFDIKGIDDNAEKEIVQMKYDMEGVAAGAKMESSITVSTNDEIELACVAKMIELLSDSAVLGGKSAVGHGAFNLECNMDLKTTAYDTFLFDNKQDINDYIKELEGILK